MTEHTPGPWTVAPQGDNNRQLPILAQGQTIAAIRDQGSLADAKLIAAAPTMLAALVEVAEEFMSARTYEEGLTVYMDASTVEAVREAIEAASS